MSRPASDLSRFRADFPALRRRRAGKAPVYLNNACATLRPRAVIDAIARYYERFPTCGGGRAEGPDDPHDWFQGELREEEDRAREAVGRLLGAERADEIVWVRNTTEALNLVAQGLPLEPGDEVLQGENEHNSSLLPWLEVERRLRRRAGDPSLVVRRFFDLSPDGSFDLGRALAALTPRTRVVAIAHASNLDGGTVADEDVRSLARAVHARGGVLVLDAAQSVPRRRVSVRDLEADFVAFSFHKMCGPSGMGALWGRADRLALLEPFLVGGDTVADVWQDRVEYRAPPRRFEAGLQDYAGMLGAEAAVAYVAGTVGLDAIEAHERALGRYLYERLSPLEGEHLWILGPRDPARRSGILTLGASTGALVNAIARRADEEHNVMVRRGMFCANAYLHRRFDASGHAHDLLRASVYLYNTEDECEVFCRVVERVARDPLAFLDDA